MMKVFSIFIMLLALGACCMTVAASSAHVQEPQTSDKPRPEIWKEYPALKETTVAGLAAMEDWLEALEPESFAQKYPGMVQLAGSENRGERIRALRAIAELREVSGLSILIRAVESRERAERLAAAQCLSKWVYDEYHFAERTPPANLEPLLPFFVTTLVHAGDEPNVRCCCFRVIGSLAGPEWLPLVEDLSANRHPAVTHWSGWAIRQLTRRRDTDAVPGKLPEGDAASVTHADAGRENAPWGEVSNDLQCRLLPMTQTVEVPQGTKPLHIDANVTYELRNAGDKPIRFLRDFTPLEGLLGNIFDVVGPDGKKVRYVGVHFMRDVPTREDFLPIAPGQRLSRRVRLAYDFRNPGVYKVSITTGRTLVHGARYYYEDPEEAKQNPDNVWTGTLQSNTVTIRVVRPEAEDAP